MIKKILKVLGIVTLVFCLMIITIRLNSLENNIKDSTSVLQEEISVLSEQSNEAFQNDLLLLTKLQDLTRDSTQIADIIKEQIAIIHEEIKEVNYEKILKGDVLVTSLFGSGAGTVVRKTDKEMYVLTCYHVVAEIVELNNAGIKIDAIVGYTLGDSGDMESLSHLVSFSAQVMKYDEDIDLALLKINMIDSNLEEIKIAEQEPKKGSEVYSVGTPLGLMRTVSKGILANKIVGFYLTDSTTTFGNSGGGLYNKKGELIGVPSNVMGYAGGLNKDGKETFVPESSLGLSRNLSTIKAFLEGVIY